MMDGEYGNNSEWGDEPYDPYTDEEGAYYQGYGDDEWGHEGNQNSWWNDEDTMWAQSEWHEYENEETEVSTEELKALIQAQEEAERSFQDSQVMLAENERNLQEARRAVAAASRDRGWGGAPQQKGRNTSTYMKGKDFSKYGKGKGMSSNYMKGKDKGYNKGFGKSKGLPFGKGPGKHGGKSNRSAGSTFLS